MAVPTKQEQISALQQELEDIHFADLLLRGRSRSERTPAALAEHQRRQRRAEEIKRELASLNAEQ